MVYLKKIEAKGFKSMGSKLMSIPVERGFVAITGPNGSGKSNLLDAILFALGENSAKTLRAPNLGALIYDGSVEEQKPSSAKVSLQFDNVDRRIPVDSDNVTITRELKISGESNYFLNGRHVQRNNLSELLEMALITSRGLNVVLQGMITRISELVPDEKRKLIEQMVGVAQFDEKKNQALTQLKEADVKLEIAMARIGEIRDTVQRLEQERNDQLRMKQLEDQIHWLRAATTSARLANVRRLIQQKQDSSKELANKLSQLQASQQELSTAIEGLDTERNQLIQSAMDAGSAKVQIELSKLEADISALMRQRQEASDLIEKVRQITPTLSQMSSDYVSKISQTEAQILSLEQKLSEAIGTRDVFTSKQHEIGVERAALEREMGIAQSKRARMQRLKETQDSKLQTSREQLSQLKSEQKMLEDKKASLQNNIKFYADAISSAQKNIADLDSLLEIQRGQLNQLRDSRSNVESMRRKVEEQLDLALLILDKAQLAITKYDSDLSAMENIAGEEIALTRLESLGQTAALSGYIGPLRTLLTYGGEFSQAIAALGREWLNAVVVQDIASLIRITEAAKKLKIARLTAIPLSEVADLEPQQHAQSFEGLVAPVCDVIDCDPKLKCIVNFIFGDSLIVESAKYAYIAARKGFRAVTLQGDVFEPEVLAFETGYSKKYAQITTLLGQQDTFEGIRSALSALKGAIDKRKIAVSKLNAKSTDFQKTETEQDRSIARIESKLESTRQFFGKYFDSSNAQREKLKEVEKELEKTRTAITISEKRVAALSLGSQKMVQVLALLDLNSFNSRFADVAKSRAEIESKLEGVAVEIRELETEITRARAELENNQKPSLERLRQQQSETQANFESKTKFLAETEPRLAELKAALAALKEREADTIEKANKFQPLLESLDARIKSLKAEEEVTRRAVLSADKELFAANNDLTRHTESERNLVGELAIYGYTEPTESFEGADVLLKELGTEFDALRNSVNLLADRSYKEVFENYKYSSVRKNELEKERNAIVTFIETIDSEKRKVFMDAFERIDKEIRIIFSKLTNGSAWLEIEKPDSIFDSGVFLMAQFPGKLPRDSSGVSGGEKTISALSLILAIQAVFPSPFYVFDEVDAHLDSVYSGRLAEILAERSGYSQLIMVSLKDTVVSKAQSVIGVYMQEGSSRVIRYRSGMEVEVRNE